MKYIILLVIYTIMLAVSSILLIKNIKDGYNKKTKHYILSIVPSFLGTLIYFTTVSLNLMY